MTMTKLVGDHRRLFILKWVSNGSDPTDPAAPSIYELDELVTDELLVEAARGGNPIKWLMTHRGRYEKARLQTLEDRSWKPPV